MQVADVLGVVVAGDDEHREAVLEQGLEVALGGGELARVTLLGEVAADHHQVGVEGDRLLDRRLQQLTVEEGRPAVQVGHLGDDELATRHLDPSVRERPGTPS